MRLGFPRKLCIGLGLLFSAALASNSLARTGEKPSVEEIVQKAVAHAQESAASPSPHNFTYSKVTVTEEFDAAGNIKERKEKLYQVFFQDGVTHLKLLGVNGHPPAEADLKKLSDNDATARKILGESKSRTQNRDNFLTPELVTRFEFKLAGQQKINGRDAYEVSFQPKSPNATTHHIIDRLLNRISGTLWIDAQEYELARADLQLKSEVNLLGGVIGSLKKLDYSMTRSRVADGVWVNTSSSGDFWGRKLIEDLRIKTRSESRNFRRLG